jgi:hypothetical protein
MCKEHAEFFAARPLHLSSPRNLRLIPSELRGGGDRKHYRTEFQGLGRNAGERQGIEKGTIGNAKESLLAP